MIIAKCVCTIASARIPFGIPFAKTIDLISSLIDGEELGISASPSCLENKLVCSLSDGLSYLFGCKNTSTPRLRIARDTSPLLGSTAKNNRNPSCAFTMRLSPFGKKPHSFTNKVPSGSSKGFKRSSTVGEHRFAFSSKTQSPRSTAFSKAPSTHSNRPASFLGPTLNEVGVTMASKFS